MSKVSFLIITHNPGNFIISINFFWDFIKKVSSIFQTVMALRFLCVFIFNSGGIEKAEKNFLCNHRFWVTHSNSLKIILWNALEKLSEVYRLIFSYQNIGESYFQKITRQQQREKIKFKYAQIFEKRIPQKSSFEEVFFSANNLKISTKSTAVSCIIKNLNVPLYTSCLWLKKFFVRVFVGWKNAVVSYGNARKICWKENDKGEKELLKKNLHLYIGEYIKKNTRR